MISDEAEEITDFSIGWKSGMNILGIVLFSIVLGLVIGQMQEEGRILHVFFDRMQNAIIKIVHLIIWWVIMSLLYWHDL